MSTDHATLRLVVPQFDSPLTDLIIDLDHLRRKEFVGTTPTQLFVQLKRFFFMLESIGLPLDSRGAIVLEKVLKKSHFLSQSVVFSHKHDRLFTTHAGFFQVI